MSNFEPSTHYFDRKKTRNKGMETGTAGGLGSLVGFILAAVLANNPSIALTGEGQAAVIGLTTAGLAGAWTAFRNWRKHRRDRRL